MRGIEFISKNNNKYFYNDETGFIELVKENIPKNYGNINELLKENNDITYATEQEIKDYLLEGNGFKHLILEVTQNCNLRCKYCCYGDYYKNTRNPSNEIMTFETGKKSIDYYMKMFKSVTYKNPFKNPSVGFYGGEPLLNFKLIKKLVKYMKTQYPDYKFDHNMTTNGLLLNEEVADFIVENDICVLVSLDGNKENHDRNRIKINGEGSFDEVFANINRFRDKYPDYFKISFGACYDYNTDLDEMKVFIEENDLFFTTMSLISNIETDYYEKFTEEEKIRFYKTFYKLQKEFLKLAEEGRAVNLNKNIYFPLFLGSYLELSHHSLISNTPKKILPYTGSCIPGEKLYASVDGKLHICERITSNFPIGDVDKGLDYKKITNIVNDFNAYQNQCSKCDISRLCGICYSKVTCKDRLVINPKLCQSRKDDCEVILTNYINIMEKNPEEFEKTSADYFTDLSIRTNGILF